MQCFRTKDQWVVFFPTWIDLLLWLSGLYEEHGKNYLVSSPHFTSQILNWWGTYSCHSSYDMGVQGKITKCRVILENSSSGQSGKFTLLQQALLVCCSLSFSIAPIQLLDRISALTRRGLTVSKPLVNEVIKLSSLLNKQLMLRSLFSQKETPSVTRG